MAPAFENLFPIVRGKKTYYCIFEARQNLFSRTDGSTRMTWIKLLSIVVSPASEGEQEILERNFPWECQNPFLLISQGDLTRLLYCGNPHKPFRWLPSIPPDHHPSDVNASWTVTSEHRRNDNLVQCTKFPPGCRSGEGWYSASPFQQTACPYRKRSLVTAMCILPAEKLLLTLPARLTKGKFLGKTPQGRTTRTPLREGETMPQRCPHLQ